MTDDRPNTVFDLWIAAYYAGYDDGRHERDCDPGLVMPDWLSHLRLGDDI